MILPRDGKPQSLGRKIPLHGTYDTIDSLMMVTLISSYSSSHEAQIKNDRGNLPIHTAASFRAPLELAEALLEAYPESASMTNNYGNLALHFTAWKKGPLEVEKLLLKICLLYTSPSPRDRTRSRMPSSA